MRYGGQTFQIPCNRGGLSHNQNIDLIPPEAMVHPTRNININEGGRGKRGGTSQVTANPISGSPRIMGIYQFRLKNGNEFIVTATNDGKIYKDYVTELKSGLTANKVTTFETFKNVLYICNGADKPQTWDGSAGSTSDHASVPTDWSGGASGYPAKMIKHGRGVSERMWAIGCPNDPFAVYASANGDADDFSDSNVIKLNIETGDGFGIVGAVVYGDRLICTGKRRPYIIEDSPSDTSNWGYSEAQFEGGAASHRLIVRTPNDIVCMMEDGEIYSATAVASYGDYKLASLTQPSFMHEWIKTYVKLSAIADFHMVYDPALRAIKIFVVKNGQTRVDTALVYFIDRGPQEGWMIHDNQDAFSGYAASCSTVVRKNTGDYKIYTGAYYGNVWELETADKNDDGDAYYAGFKIPKLAFENARLTKRFDRGWLVLEPKGNYDIYINWWIDGVAQTQRIVSLLGAGVPLGTFVLGTNYLREGDLINEQFVLGNIGKRIQMEIFNSNADEDFFISQVLIDFTPLGSRVG